MNIRAVVVSTIAGGILLTILSIIFSLVANAVAPYDIFSIGGMRAITDPIMALYFLYPFVFALTTAIVFGFVKGSLKWKNPGAQFGLLLFLIATVPSMFMIFASMTYPIGFYIENILGGIISFPLLGILFASVWKKLK